MSARGDERAERAAEAQQQDALRLHEVLVALTRAISRTGDPELIESWDWLRAFLMREVEKVAAMQDQEQENRRRAAKSQRSFDDEQFLKAAKGALSDKDIARKLGVHATTIARYRADKKKQPSFLEKILRKAAWRRAHPRPPRKR